MEGHGVSFVNSGDCIFLVGQPIDCRIRLAPDFETKTRDWIGLFLSPYGALDDYVTFQWVETACLDESRDDEDKLSMERVITFRSHLPRADSDNKYVFVYVSNHQALATSAPFQFRNYQQLPPNMHEVDIHSFVALVSQPIGGENEEKCDSEISRKVSFEEKPSSPVKKFANKMKPLRREVEGMELAHQHSEVYPSTTSSFEVIASMNRLSVMEDECDQPEIEDYGDQPGLKITIRENIAQERKTQDAPSQTSGASSMRMLQRNGEAEPTLPSGRVTDSAIGSSGQHVTDYDIASQKQLNQRPSATLSGSYSSRDSPVTSTTGPSKNPKLPSKMEGSAQPSSSLTQQTTGNEPSPPVQSKQSSLSSHSVTSPQQSDSTQQTRALLIAVSTPKLNSTRTEPLHQLQQPIQQQPTVKQQLQSTIACQSQPPISVSSAQLQRSLSEPTTKPPQSSLDILSPSVEVVTTPSTSSMEDYTTVSTPDAQAHYNSCPLTTAATLPTNSVVVASSMSSNAPAFSGSPTDSSAIISSDFLQKSAFVDEAEYNRVMRQFTTFQKELNLTKQAYQREHAMAERAMAMGQSHKKQVDVLEQQLAHQEQKMKTESAKLARVEESKWQLEQAYQENEKHLSALLKSDAELRETKHRLKKAVQRREDNLRNQSEERESLRASNNFLKDELRQIEQLAATQLRKMSAFPKGGAQEVEARFLVQTLVGMIDSRFSRQTEALLTLQEEHTAESRRWLAEKNELTAQLRHLEERAQRAEHAESDTVHSLERMAERQRQTMKENDSLRQQLQEAQRASGRTTYSLYDTPSSAPQTFGNPGSLSQVGVSSTLPPNGDAQVPNDSPVTFSFHHRQDLPLPSTQLPSVSTRSILFPGAHKGPSVSAQSVQHVPTPSELSVSTPDSSEEPPPEGLKCPVCGKESSHYLTMRMWQWHVNGHFN